MKKFAPSLLSIPFLIIGFTSCQTQPRPNPQQQYAIRASPPPYESSTVNNNPYGVPASSVPDANPPYQPIPDAPVRVTGTRQNASSSTSHTVVSGDTLWKLSRRYGTSVDAIQSANGMTGTTIYKGQVLRLPQ